MVPVLESTPFAQVRYHGFEAESASTLIVGTILSIPTLLPIVSIFD
jgi:hypothetical protein